jgi:malate dehydrogenase
VRSASSRRRLGTTVTDIKKMTIWGNHSVTQYPDLFHAEVNGQNAYEAVNDQAWYAGTYIPTVAKRGAAIIEARGASSAASAPTPRSTTSARGRSAPRGRLGVDGGPSDGSYGVPEGLISRASRHVCKDGQWSIVQGLDIDEFSRGKIDASVAELAEERDAVKGLGLI